MDDPKWLAKARSYIGVKEAPGSANNPQIVKWWKELSTGFVHDSVPWCGGFVGGCLHETGYKTVPGPAMARAWLRLPVKLDKPAVGCIVVFWRGKKNSNSGHVGFVVGKDRYRHLMVLGGNQGDKVCIAAFATVRVLGYRWPSVWPLEERFKLPLLDSDGTVSSNES
jgi:uncharacterized protein (TIGR02594 family)